MEGENVTKEDIAEVEEMLEGYKKLRVIEAAVIKAMSQNGA